MDKLAQRWHCHPGEVVADPEWMLRGLAYMELEAMAQPRQVSGRKDH